MRTESPLGVAWLLARVCTPVSAQHPTCAEHTIACWSRERLVKEGSELAVPLSLGEYVNLKGESTR